LSLRKAALDEEEAMAGEIIEALCSLDERRVLGLVRQQLDAGTDPMQILDEARQALLIVGERFEAGEYFIPELVYSGEILKQISEMVKPHIRSESKTERIGTVVLGTVAGDIHDIGKDIVAFMLDVNGFDVLDLGVDVPPEVFVNKVEESGAPVVGLSGFLTSAFESMKRTVEAFRDASLRDSVRIMIGGGQVDDAICRYTGADGWGRDAMDAVALARGWITKR
jgi:5-methyltetrahydrofolate--homocysteine methyltransferase